MEKTSGFLFEKITIYDDIDIRYITRVYNGFSLSEFDFFLKYNYSVLVSRSSLTPNRKEYYYTLIKALPAFKKYCFYRTFQGCYIELLIDILTGEHLAHLIKCYEHVGPIKNSFCKIYHDSTKLSVNEMDHAFATVEPFNSGYISIKTTTCVINIPKTNDVSIYSPILKGSYNEEKDFDILFNILSRIDKKTELNPFLNYLMRNIIINKVTQDNILVYLNKLNTSITLRRILFIYYYVTNLDITFQDTEILENLIPIIILTACMMVTQGCLIHIPIAHSYFNKLYVISPYLQSDNSITTRVKIGNTIKTTNEMRKDGNKNKKKIRKKRTNKMLYP